MKGKKYLSLLLALVIVLTLAACGGSPAQPANDADAAAPTESGYKTDSLVVNIVYDATELSNCRIYMTSLSSKPRSSPNRT